MKYIALLILSVCTSFGQVAFTFNSDRITALSYNGQSYWGSATQTSTLISCFLDGVSTSMTRTSATSTGLYYEHQYTGGGTVITIRYTPSSVNGGDTFKLLAQITNTSGSATVTKLQVWPLQLDLPNPSTNIPSSGQSAIGKDYSPYVFIASTPYNLVQGASSLSDNIQSSFANSTGKQSFSLVLSTAEDANGPEAYSQPVAPGDSFSMAGYYTWSAAEESTASLYVRSIVNGDIPLQATWPDRRPIMRMFLADYTQRGTNNPRGFLRGSPGFDVWDSAAFRTAMLAQFDLYVSSANSYEIRPQGMLIWDMEGQEFAHALTYTGAPNHIAELAPEMDAIADEAVAKITSAGYKVGFTLRPQRLLYAASNPVSCTTSYNGGGTPDLYINTANCAAGSWPCSTRIYECTATNTWGNSNQNGYGYQTDLYNVTEILAELREKINYAVNRYGASFFYIDSTGYFGASEYSNNIWRQIQTEFPTIMFLIENNRQLTTGWVGAYEQSNQGVFLTTSLARSVWPIGAYSGITSEGGWLEPGGEDALKAGWKRGDIQLHNGFLSTALEVETTGTWMNELVDEMKTISIVDSSNGQAKVFGSNPRGSFTYPLTQRIYFASASGDLHASTTFCTRINETLCYLAGELQPTAALDLSALPYHQIRYYDFAGNQVSEGPYATLQ